MKTLKVDRQVNIFRQRCVYIASFNVLQMCTCIKNINMSRWLCSYLQGKNVKTSVNKKERKLFSNLIESLTTYITWQATYKFNVVNGFNSIVIVAGIPRKRR